jgi:hypothetical protein
MLTPECASPERALGKPVTTVSEIYSLGVLLNCRQQPRLKRVVIEIVRPTGPDRMRVDVGKFGFSPEDLARDGMHGTEFTVSARGDRAWYLQPFANIAEFSDAFQNFRRRSVNCDFQRNGDVGRIRQSICRAPRASESVPDDRRHATNASAPPTAVLRS